MDFNRIQLWLVKIQWALPNNDKSVDDQIEIDSVWLALVFLNQLFSTFPLKSIYCQPAMGQQLSWTPSFCLVKSGSFNLLSSACSCNSRKKDRSQISFNSPSYFERLNPWILAAGWPQGEILWTRRNRHIFLQFAMQHRPSNPLTSIMFVGCKITYIIICKSQSLTDGTFPLNQHSLKGWNPTLDG